MATLTLRIDPARVADLAARALAELQRDNPEQFERLNAAVDRGGGGMFAVTLTSDGRVSVALAGVVLWSGPRALVERAAPGQRPPRYDA